ncbi:MAG: hypothetical protein OET79_13825, partial [Nitrospirota bacterium]|nr:hypothetical protein [Nitrospirota bacterium]
MLHDVAHQRVHLLQLRALDQRQLGLAPVENATELGAIALQEWCVAWSGGGSDEHGWADVMAACLRSAQAKACMVRKRFMRPAVYPDRSALAGLPPGRRIDRCIAPRQRCS